MTNSDGQKSEETLLKIGYYFAKTCCLSVLQPAKREAHFRYFKYQYLYPYRIARDAPFEEKKHGIFIRKYRSTAEYIGYQKSKLDLVAPGLKRQFDSRVQTFYESRFARLFSDQAGKSILCLGARDGAEVLALRRHGLLAVGIDLAFPSDNPYVHFGDFHAIPYPDGCFDYVYMNVFDHILEPEKLLAEIRRVLRPGTGKFFLDLLHGSNDVGGEHDVRGTFESFGWNSIDDVIKIITAVGFVLDDRQEIEHNYVQLLFAKY